MILRHIHFPTPVPYTHADILQQTLVKTLLTHKASPKTIPAPNPTILTAQFHPVYTCGRREVGTLSKNQINYLTAPTPLGTASFHESLRGGQTTFHGPGQLVAYPIIDLRRHGLSPKCYVNYLEQCVMDILIEGWSIKGIRTENPGIWIDQERKICAVGVHLRRNVTSHGIGLNLRTKMGWFERIVACGLEGKRVVNLEMVAGKGEGDMEVEKVAEMFVRRFGEGLEGVNAIRRIGQEEAFGQGEG
ncbi:hypothetical protein DOTSEDRAFT_180972 [Dothistroma septosporum NZE10]|uniref:Octanoyltransferase n=1 Tax=Dothistroma septosporum (strain NZE10 / CBS 128990) TaxID=675120 RepID=M2XHM4_DOTSN|nr:hypothetical protein DOTSEDRAFT_180972 [Dothistroma septosporum NZE10]